MQSRRASINQCTKFRFLLICPPVRYLLGLPPQTRLLRLTPPKNPPQIFFGFFKNSSDLHPVFLLSVRGQTAANRDTLFSHSYFRLVASTHGMSASGLLSSRLMFPTPLASDKGTSRDAANLDVFLSDNGIFRKRNKNGTIWSLSLSAAVFYLTPAASEGYRSTLKPTAFRNQSPSSNLSAMFTGKLATFYFHTVYPPVFLTVLQSIF